MRRALFSMLVAVSCSPPPTPTPPDSGPGCVRGTCDPGVCGELSDGCTGILQCGRCPSGETCGGGGSPNVCGPGTCAPKTCFEQGKNCGRLTDGCSRWLDCGTCRIPADCGANRNPNVCGNTSCVRRSCPANACGNNGPDDCNGMLDCGLCIEPQTCGGGGEAKRCGCIPKSCAQLGAQCGQLESGCGGFASCGACASGTCSVNAEPNVCGTCPADSRGRVCSAGCWCWEAPRLTGNPLTTVWGRGPSDVWMFGKGGLYLHQDAAGSKVWPGPRVFGIESAWGSGPDDVWAVGTSPSATDTMVHWDGIGWWPVKLPLPASLHGVWGFSASDIWAVGGENALRWNGATWSRVAFNGNPGFFSVWGTASDDVWLGADDGMHHFDGTNWASGAVGNGRIYSVHGTARDDVWAATLQGMFHFDGTRWTSATETVPELCTKVWAIARDDVWAVVGGRLMHFDGTRFSNVTLEPNRVHDALWASGRDDVWTSVGSKLFHRDASGWSAASSLEEPIVFGVHAVSATEQWAVGDRGRLLRGDGTKWTHVLTGVAEGLISVSGAQGRVWAAGTNGTILTSIDGGPFTRQTSPATSLTAIFARAADEAWAVGAASTVQFWDGGTWAALPPSGAGDLNAVWAAGPNDVWVGESPGAKIFHWNGSQWSLEYQGVFSSRVSGLHGAGGEVFATVTDGAAALILRRVAGAFVALPGPSGIRWNAIWAGAANDVWLAGNDGNVARWDGAQLTVFRAPLPNDVFGISGAGGKVWTLGTWGTLTRFDAPGVASSQIVEHVHFDDDLLDISGTAPDDVWAVGSAAPHHWNGRQWQTHQLPPSGVVSLRAVWSQAPGDVWVTTANGHAWHFDGGSWADYPVSSNSLESVWASGPNDVWVGGGYVLERWNGSAWTVPSVAPVIFGGVRAVAGSGPSDVWAVGGAVLHFDGGQWVTQVNLGPAETLMAVSCRASDDCWTVGTRQVARPDGGPAPHPVAMRWNGLSWFYQAPLPDIVPSDVVVRGRDDVFLFGSDGAAFHWDGGTWTSLPMGALGAFHAWGSDAGVWAVSGSSVLFHR